MQDLRTGELHPLPEEFFKGLPTLPNGLPSDSREYRERLQQACDNVQPDRQLQGPVFIVGEILELRGGRFQITKVEPGHLRLKSLPRA